MSAAWGLVVGRDALKGITQPDTRPANNLAQRQKGAPRREDVAILKEEEIINTVKTRMNGGVAAERKATAPKPAEAKPDAKPVGATASPAADDADLNQ